MGEKQADTAQKLKIVWGSMHWIDMKALELSGKLPHTTNIFFMRLFLLVKFLEQKTFNCLSRK